MAKAQSDSLVLVQLQIQSNDQTLYGVKYDVHIKFDGGLTCHFDIMVSALSARLLKNDLYLSCLWHSQVLLLFNLPPPNLVRVSNYVRVLYHTNIVLDTHIEFC